MYIPMVEIPGCQPDDQSDNREGEQVLDASAPRETVTLRFGSLPDYEVAAEFYSYIAYPDPAAAGFAGAGFFACAKASAPASKNKPAKPTAPKRFNEKDIRIPFK